jgi:glycosyltransferase involved in cell wall biosynthesis
MRARPLRILFMAHVRWFNAEAQYALDLAGECRREGHSVWYYTQSGSPVAAEAEARGIRTFEESGFNAKGVAGIWGVFPAIARLAKILRGGRIDAVEVFRPEGFVVIALVCRFMNIPVVRVRGDMRPVRQDILNRLLHKKVASGVVASNTAVASELQQRLGPMPLLKTIHGGVDAGVFRPDGPVRDIRSEMQFPADAFLVGILGRLGERKGHGDLVAAAEKLLTAGTRAYFVILAKERSPAADALRKSIGATPGLGSHFGFLDFQEDLPDVLRSFDLGVVASTGSEANCRVGLEWMASGVPLVGTRIGVLPDLIDVGRTGFLVPPRAPEKLTDRIGYLAENRAVARQMGLQARQRVLAHFTIEGCAAKHLDLIRKFV